MKLWKRNAVVAAIVLFVCVAVYLNWSYNNGRETISPDTGTGKTLGEAALVDGVTIVGQDGEEIPASTEGGADTLIDTYFADARLSRQQARDSALSLLRDAAASEDADQSVIDSANLSIQAMADYTMKESQIENLVTAKGYADCVAFISENSVSVVVAPPEGGLTAADVAKVTDIALSETGFSASQVKIIPAG